MSIHKIQKSLSILLTVALISTMIPCSAANLVPANGSKPVVTPSVPVTKPIVEQKNSSNDFSIQSLKSKIKDLTNPEEIEKKLQETQSGSCGDNVLWSLNKDTGVLTISGTGSITTSSWHGHESSIKSVIIENGVTSIKSWTFSCCSALTSVTISDSVTSIGSWAFFNCSALTSVTIPNSVVSIGSWAFFSCRALTSVKIPYSVTSIGSFAFSRCSTLTSINVDFNNPNYKSIDGILFNKAGTILLQCPAGNSRTYYKIPDSVTSIERGAFDGCSYLTSVTIPNSVVFIGMFAFRDCKALISVTIPNSVIFIEHSAFINCSRLASIIVDTNNPNYKSINGILFNKAGTTLLQYPAGNSRTSYEIPYFVTSIGNAAFSDCNKLTSVTIPDSVTSIEYYAFEGCIALATVNFYGNQEPTNVSSEIFCNCGNLTDINVPTTYVGEIFCGKPVAKMLEAPTEAGISLLKRVKILERWVGGIVVGIIGSWICICNGIYPIRFSRFLRISRYFQKKRQLRQAEIP